MGQDLFYFVFVPGLLALGIKLGIAAYAYHSKTRNSQTQLYLYVLGALALQNASVVSACISLSRHVFPSFEGNVFYASSILSVAFLFHLASELAFGNRVGVTNGWRATVAVVYAYAIILELLLFLTPWLIAGYQFEAPVIVRVPGHLYFLVEFFGIAGFLSIAGILMYGSRYQDTAQGRLRNVFLLIALVPMIVVVTTVLVLLHLGIKGVNAAYLSPFFITYFLAVTAYATHQHRLFDVRFYVPWSKVRKRKTAFYARIRSMAAELAHLDSVQSAVSKLADALQCSVALLVTGPKPVLAYAGTQSEVTELPISALQRTDAILVANEIAENMPQMHRVMKAHAAAAIVPFHPHSQHAAGWLVLGEAFSDQVYTARDFREVEQLFDKMADLFLDKLVAMRTQLADAAKQIRMLERRQEELYSNVEVLQEQVAGLRQENTLLRRLQTADGVTGEIGGPKPNLRIAVVGDRPLFKALRPTLPQVEFYANLGSRAFARMAAPDILIAHVEQDRRQIDALKAQAIGQSQGAMLLLGTAAHRFLESERHPLAGALVEVLPEDADVDTTLRRIAGLGALVKARVGYLDAEEPLLGESQVFVEQMAEARRLALLRDPIAIAGDDAGQALALARYVHALSSSGEARVVSAATLVQDRALASGLGAGDSVILTQFDLLSEDQVVTLVTSLASAGLRVIACVNAQAELDLAKAPFGFAIHMATLRERKVDVPLLVRYFTIQFNREAGTAHYLRQGDIDDMMASNYPETVAALRSAVFQRLAEKIVPSESTREAVPELTQKTLDEHVADYEARIIAETLKTCGGNKSKAARLLGLRPNTLHYKLTRYGLNGKGEK